MRPAAAQRHKSGRAAAGIRKRSAGSILISAAYVIFGIGLSLWLIFFGLRADLLLDSISEIGGKYGHYTEFVLLSLAFFVYYLVGGLYALRLFSYKERLMTALYSLGCVLYFAACLFPFFPKKYPVLSVIHSVSAGAALAILLIATLWFIIRLYKSCIPLAVCASITYGVMVLSSAVLMYFYGTCTLAELFALLFLVWFIASSVLYKQIKNSHFAK